MGKIKKMFMYININVIIGKKNYQKLLDQKSQVPDFFFFLSNFDGIQKMKELHYKVYEN